MKEWVAQCLAADPRFTDVATEKRWSGTLTAEWRKPDVRAIYRGIPVVFEIQLSTTYVNVIAERREFYLQEGGLLIDQQGSCTVLQQVDSADQTVQPTREQAQRIEGRSKQACGCLLRDRSSA